MGLTDRSRLLVLILRNENNIRELLINDENIIFMNSLKTLKTRKSFVQYDKTFKTKYGQLS